MAGWLISDVWLTYISSPLIVTFEPFETTIDKIPFPAITSKYSPIKCSGMIGWLID